jgi:hypothetical protein
MEIINKPSLLHLVGYLYYWQMGFNSVFKGLKDYMKITFLLVSLPCNMLDIPVADIAAAFLCMRGSTRFLGNVGKFLPHEIMRYSRIFRPLWLPQ